MILLVTWFVDGTRVRPASFIKKETRLTPTPGMISRPESLKKAPFSFVCGERGNLLGWTMERAPQGLRYPICLVWDRYSIRGTNGQECRIPSEFPFGQLQLRRLVSALMELIKLTTAVVV